MKLNKAYYKRNKGKLIKNVTYKKEQNRKVALNEVRMNERKRNRTKPEKLNY